MNIHTVLDADTAELFKEELHAKKITKYKLAKIAIQAYLGSKEKEKPDTVESIPLSGNFEEDTKTIDRSGIETSVIKKALMELDQQKKQKNTIKKGGAFHEENCMLDIRSLLDHGRPNFHEVKYHMDWWLKVGLLTNVLARRGVRMSVKHQRLNQAFEARNDPNVSHSTYADWLARHRTATK